MIKKNKFGFDQNPSYVTLIIFFIISIILIYFGLKLNKKNNLYTQQVPFTVTKIIYNNNKNYNNNNYNNNNYNNNYNNNNNNITHYILSGTIDNCKDIIKVNDYTTTSNNIGILRINSQNVIKIGETINVWVKPNCVGTDALYNKTNTPGYIFIGFGVFIINLIVFLKLKKKI